MARKNTHLNPFDNNMTPYSAASDIVKPKRRVGTSKSLVISENIFFGLFIAVAVGILFWLFLFSFPGVVKSFRKYLTGQFKRPLPLNPQLYYDVACINVHDYQTFQNPDQVTLCHNLRKVNRGPII